MSVGTSTSFLVGWPVWKFSEKPHEQPFPSGVMAMLVSLLEATKDALMSAGSGVSILGSR